MCGVCPRVVVGGEPSLGVPTSAVRSRHAHCTPWFQTAGAAPETEVEAKTLTIIEDVGWIETLYGTETQVP